VPTVEGKQFINYDNTHARRAPNDITLQLMFRMEPKVLGENPKKRYFLASLFTGL
jgi:hypothetical protein